VADPSLLPGGLLQTKGRRLRQKLPLRIRMGEVEGRKGQKGL
jgi:hypothetical protein